MKSFVKTALEKIFPVPVMHYIAYRGLILDKGSYLYSTGWMQSRKARKPIDSDGNPIPWMNFPAVRLLEERLTRDLNLFEFGSGYSTFFYASRVSTVTSVEYDEKWFDVVKSQAPENVKLIFKEKDVDGDYCRVVGSTGDRYDVVIVDGRDRVNCIKQSISALSARGIIIFDDTHRDKYQDGIDFLKRNGFRALNLEGLKPTGTKIAGTTIFYRDNNCFGI